MLHSEIVESVFLAKCIRSELHFKLNACKYKNVGCTDFENLKLIQIARFGIKTLIVITSRTIQMTRQTTQKPWRAFTCHVDFIFDQRTLPWLDTLFSCPGVAAVKQVHSSVKSPCSRMHSTACVPRPDEELSSLRWWVTNHSSDSPPPCCLFPHSRRILIRLD